MRWARLIARTSARPATASSGQRAAYSRIRILHRRRACLCRDSLIPWVALAAHHLSLRLIVRVPVLSLLWYICARWRPTWRTRSFCRLRPGTAGGADPGSPGSRVRVEPSRVRRTAFIRARSAENLIGFSVFQHLGKFRGAKMLNPNGKPSRIFSFPALG